VEGMVVGVVARARRSEGVVPSGPGAGETLSCSDVPSSTEGVGFSGPEENLGSSMERLTVSPCFVDAWLNDAGSYEDQQGQAAEGSDVFGDLRLPPARVGAVYLDDLEDMDLSLFDDIPTEDFQP